MNTLKRYLILSVYISVGLNATGQSFISSIQRDYYQRFSQFHDYAGKGLKDVLEIVQDSTGYFWFATAKGLLRFDGSRLKEYHAGNLASELPSSFVQCVSVDKSGNLWIGSKSGLSRYIRHKDSFKTYFGGRCEEKSDDSLYVRAIFPEGDSILWFETTQGYLYKMDMPGCRVIHSYRHHYVMQPYYPYHTIYRDKKGVLWIGGRGMPSYFLDENMDELVAMPFAVNRKGYKREADVAVYLEDDLGNFYVGGLDGLYLFEHETQYYEKIYSASIWSGMIDKNGHLWLGTGKGVGKLDPRAGKLVLYQNHEEDLFSLCGDNVNTIYEDFLGNIWMATENGVSVMNPDPEGVEYMFHIPGLENSPVSSVITDLETLQDGRIAIGTYQRGIDIMDPLTNRFVHYNSGNVPGMITDKVRCISESVDGELFIGLWAGMGFGKLIPGTGAYTHYRYDPLSLSKDWYNDLEFGKGQLLYLGFWGSDGLMEFDTKTERFMRSLKNRFQSFHLSRLITSLHFDSRERLWVGTTQTGIHCYFPEKDTTSCYFVEINPVGGFPEEHVNDVVEDFDGNIWTGTTGVYIFDEITEAFRKIPGLMPLDSIEVFKITSMPGSMLLLLTEKGLFLYNYVDSVLLDLSEKVRLRFSSGSACGTLSGTQKALIGGNNGLAFIEPEKLRLNQDFPRLYFPLLDFYDKGEIYNIRNDTLLKLAYNENFFNIHIGVNAWNTETSFKYLFKLENFDQDWQQVAPGDMAVRFTNVPPGNYVFRMLTEDENGFLSPGEASFKIQIVPPFWKRWWFVVMGLILVITGIYMFNNWRMKNVRLALQNLEIKQKLLRLQMNPHFIFNSLSAIQNFIYTHQTHQAGEYLSEFARLIRIILENSRKEEISLENEIHFIQLYLELQQLRFVEKFDYFIEVDPGIDVDNILIPPMLFQPFLENAIEHGIKYSDRKGIIKMSYELKERSLIFTLDDNGIGLSAAESIKKQKEKNHESLAIGIIKQRLLHLKRRKGMEVSFFIEELKDSTGKASGTRVQFVIPVKQKFIDRI